MLINQVSVTEYSDPVTPSIWLFWGSFGGALPNPTYLPPWLGGMSLKERSPVQSQKITGYLKLLRVLSQYIFHNNFPFLVFTIKLPATFKILGGEKQLLRHITSNLLFNAYSYQFTLSILLSQPLNFDFEFNRRSL